METQTQGSQSAPSHRPLDEVLAAVMSRLKNFAFAPTTTRHHLSYSVHRVIQALLEHSPNTLGLAQDLWKTLGKRTTGPEWQVYWSSLELEVDEETGLPRRVMIDDAGLDGMTNKIKASPNVQSALFRWAENFFQNFFQPMRQKSRSSTPSDSSSATAKRSSNFRKSLFQRDGPSCLLSAIIELDAPEADVGEWTTRFAEPGNKPFREKLEGAHIIPLSVAKRKATLLLLSQFSGGLINADDINDETINSPENGIIMDLTAHQAFDSFRFGIECRDTPNSNVPDYRVCFVDDRMLPKNLDGCDQRHLRFGLWQSESRDGPKDRELIPLPNANFLRVHLALARVLHASGAGEVVEKIFREEEEMKAQNGNLPTSSDPELENDWTESWAPTALSYIDRRLEDIGVI